MLVGNPWEENRRVLVQLYSSTLLQNTGILNSALAVAFFTELQTIGREPGWDPLIYAAMLSTLLAGLLVVDVMWFWGQVLETADEKIPTES